MTLPMSLAFCEFAGWIDDDVFRAGLERAAGQRDVARVENAFEIRGLEAVRSESFLRIIEIDLFGQHAGTIDARDFGRAEQRAREQVGEVVELVVGVFVAWRCGDEAWRSRSGSRATTGGHASGCNSDSWNFSSTKVFP